jgi:CRP-like cAMP-binding protein
VRRPAIPGQAATHLPRFPQADQGETQASDAHALAASGDASAGPAAVLSTNHFLATLPEHELAGLLRSADVKEVAAGATLTVQGRPVDTIYFIWEGRAKTLIRSAKRKDSSAVLDLLGPASDIGLLSVVDEAPHSATVVAMTKVKALGVPKERVREVLERYPECYQTVTRVALARLRNSGIWMEHLL